MKSKTHRLTFSAIISSISLILLYFASVVPSGAIAVFSLSTAVLCAIVVECGTRFALMSFVAVGLLGFLILPNKLILIPYVLFFGYYPVLKLYIERLNKIVVEWIIKLSSFSVTMIITYYLIKLIFEDPLKIGFSVYLVIIAALLVFMVYDFAISLFIGFYNSRIARHFK